MQLWLHCPQDQPVLPDYAVCVRGRSLALAHLRFKSASNLRSVTIGTRPDMLVMLPAGQPGDRRGFAEDEALVVAACRLAVALSWAGR